MNLFVKSFKDFIHEKYELGETWKVIKSIPSVQTYKEDYETKLDMITLPKDKQLEVIHSDNQTVIFKCVDSDKFIIFSVLELKKLPITLI